MDPRWLQNNFVLSKKMPPLDRRTRHGLDKNASDGTIAAAINGSARRRTAVAVINRSSVFLVGGAGRVYNPASGISKTTLYSQTRVKIWVVENVNRLNFTYDMPCFAGASGSQKKIFSAVLSLLLEPALCRCRR